MRVIYDLNIILDVLLDRAPHAERSARALALSEIGVVEVLICACSIGTLDYLPTKALGSDASRRHLATLSEILTVAGVSSDVIAAALGLGWPDLEDAIVHECARLAEGDAVVTRDRSGFTRAGLRVYTPAELLAAVDGT